MFSNFSSLRIAVAFFLISIMFHCTDPARVDNCDVSDHRILGQWKLSKKCQCYNNGGDFIWKNVFDDYTLLFSSNCLVTQEGNTGTSCNPNGKFSIDGHQLETTFYCSNGSTTTNLYDYFISINSDTLTLKGNIDEGYVGLKYLRQK